MDGHPARGLWSGRHLTWHINCLEMLAVYQALKHFFPVLRDHHVLVCTDNTMVVFYINHLRRSAVAPPVQAGASDTCVIPGQTPLAESSLHPWAHQCGSRHPVKAGAEARAMDASHRGGEADLESVWPGSGGPFLQLGRHRNVPSGTLAPLGLDAMVQTWPRRRLYAFPPIALLPGVLETLRRYGVRLLQVALN